MGYENAKSLKKKKKKIDVKTEDDDIGNKSFTLESSNASAEPIDTSAWPILLKVKRINIPRIS